MKLNLACFASILFTISCGSSAGTDLDSSSMDSGPIDAAHGLPVVNPFDLSRATAGANFLHNNWPGRAVLPKQALSYLWLVWGTGPVSDERQWAEIDKRYGLFRESGSSWPVGLVDVDANNLSFNCLLCHATRGVSPGEAWIGVGNARLDLDRLYRDLSSLASIAEENGLGTFPFPFDLAGATRAPGAVDGVGLGMLFAGTVEELGDPFGYQQAPAWWTMRYKKRLYTDGAGQVGNWRTMMSTLFSFGMSQTMIQSYDENFQNLRHYLLSLEPPKWPFLKPSIAESDAGRGVYQTHCSACHGNYEGSNANYPGLVIASDDLGTDRLREQGMDDFQVAAINSSWYGEPGAWENTNGYLAPALIGVWATAPYLHNGSVPDLLGVLDSSQRPLRWWYSPDTSYDETRVGWRYQESGDPESAYDTSAAGLSNRGHDYGDALSETDRKSLLDYLKTL